MQYKLRLNDSQYLHYDANGNYVIKDEKEMDEYEATLGEGNAIPTRHPSSEELKYILLDKYFYLKDRHKSYMRDKQHGMTDPHSTQLFERSEKNILALRQAISLVAPELVDKKDEELRSILHKKVQKSGRYYGDELSDDSDSDDDAKYEQKEASKRMRTYQSIEAMQDDEFWLKTQREVSKGSSFSRKIAKDKLEIKDGKIQSKKAKKRRPAKKPRDVLDDSLNALKTNLYERAELGTKLTDEQQKDFDRLKELMRQGTLTQEELDKINTKFCIAQYRGLNYMLDRWNADSRRYHWQEMDEVGKPQHSEMTLRTLPFNFYSELNANNDYTQGPYPQELANTAAAIKKFLLELRNTGPCVDSTAESKAKPYLFNNVFDRFQHRFSNGIDSFLAELQQLRADHPDYWGTLPNAHNPAVATGDRPYHALKYAHGLKNYYFHPLSPRYHASGKSEYRHAGKVYVSLHDVQDFFTDQQPNRVSQLNKAGRTPIQRDIAPEKETAYWGELPADKICCQYVVKYPSFDKPYKKIYAIKYGFDKSLYEAFQYLMQNTPLEPPLRDRAIALIQDMIPAKKIPPGFLEEICNSFPETPSASQLSEFIAKKIPQDVESRKDLLKAVKELTKSLREKVVELLNEWLCAYREVLLIKLAQQKARDEGKVLVYINHDGVLDLVPDQELFLSGKGNLAVRNEGHLRRDFRSYLAKQVSENDEVKLDYKKCPGFKLVDKTVIADAAQRMSSSDEELYVLGRKNIRFSEDEAAVHSAVENERANKERADWIKKARTEIDTLIKQGAFFAPAPNPVLMRAVVPVPVSAPVVLTPETKAVAEEPLVNNKENKQPDVDNENLNISGVKEGREHLQLAPPLQPSQPTPIPFLQTPMDIFDIATTTPQSAEEKTPVKREESKETQPTVPKKRKREGSQSQVRQALIHSFFNTPQSQKDSEGNLKRQYTDAPPPKLKRGPYKKKPKGGDPEQLKISDGFRLGFG